MILFTNGCSWTYGGGLNLDKPSHTLARLSRVWPHHLGQLLNSERVFNLAAGCGSNQRIFRTTINWLCNTPTNILENTMAIIQWTQLHRFELYHPTSNEKYEDIEENWLKVKIDNVQGGKNLDTDYLVPQMNNFLRFYHDNEGFYRTLAYMEALHSLFKSYNIKYYYWSHDDSFKDLTIEKSKLLQRYNWLGDPYNTWVYGHVSPTDGHPSFEGHKQIANIIYNYLKETA